MGGDFHSTFAMTKHAVTMTQPFRISRFEMTQDLYTAIMGRNPSRWTGPRNSVESMSLLDAQVFCTNFTAALQAARLIEASENVRLPTEAEWEYCCRGNEYALQFWRFHGTASDPDESTSILNEYAWHTGNAAGNDPAVGVLKPNPWGLFDMHGYLWEFVSDEYTASPMPPDTSPSPPAKASGSSVAASHDHAVPRHQRSTAPADSVSSERIGFHCIMAQKPPPAVTISCDALGTWSVCQVQRERLAGHPWNRDRFGRSLALD